MCTEKLNVIFLGSTPFPQGYAMTKRWRYIIDYLDEQGVSTHFMIIGKKVDNLFVNPKKGHYGKHCDYANFSPEMSGKGYLAALRSAKKQLDEWTDRDKHNVLITSRISLVTFPLIRHAYKKGIAIVPDIVETSYLKSMSDRPMLSTIYQYISDVSNNYTLRHYSKGCLVISNNLEKEIKQISPTLETIILPNSTPMLPCYEKAKLHHPMRVLYSGTFGEKDGVAYIIKGVMKAHERGCDCDLTLLGKGADNDMKVLHQAEGLDYIHYDGFVSDTELIERMSNADVLCMTRINSVFANYGFPFKLSEYLSTGNIVLATNVGDVSQYLTHEKDCFMIPPESSEEIANTLMRIQQTPDKSIAIGKEGLSTMKRHFSKEVVGNKFIGFINVLLNCITTPQK